MTQTPQGGPDAEALFTLAQAHVQELQRLTHEIQLQTDKPKLPILSQLIFQREEQLKSLSNLDLQSLSDERQAKILEGLQNCQTMDPGIEERLQQLRNRLREQIKALKSGQVLISKYKINNPKQPGHISRDA